MSNEPFFRKDGDRFVPTRAGIGPWTATIYRLMVLRRPDGHEIGGIMGVPDALSAWNTTFEVAGGWVRLEQVPEPYPLHAYDQTVTVDYTTAGSSAQAGSDYLPVSGSLTFAPGETSTLGVAMHAKLPMLAVEFLAKAVEYYPQSARYWNDLGAAWMAAGQAQEAQPAFQTAAIPHPR